MHVAAAVVGCFEAYNNVFTKKRGVICETVRSRGELQSGGGRRMQSKPVGQGLPVVLADAHRRNGHIISRAHSNDVSRTGMVEDDGEGRSGAGGAHHFFKEKSDTSHDQSRLP